MSADETYSKFYARVEANEELYDRYREIALDIIDTLASLNANETKLVLEHINDRLL